MISGEEAQRQLEIARLDHDEHVKEAAERRGYQMQLAQMVLRGLTIVNGGAIIALFTFVGNTREQVALSLNAKLLWFAFAVFALGLAGSLAAAICGFFAQSYYGIATQHQIWSDQKQLTGAAGTNDHMSPYRRGEIAEAAGIGIALVSLACFVIGSAFALGGVLPR